MPHFNGSHVRWPDKVAGVTAEGGQWSEKTLKQNVQPFPRQTLSPRHLLLLLFNLASPVLTSCNWFKSVYLLKILITSLSIPPAPLTKSSQIRCVHVCVCLYTHSLESVAHAIMAGGLAQGPPRLCLINEGDMRSLH